MLHPKMILIDLDGTLIDSVPDLAYCIDRTMERLGRPPHGESLVRNWVGNGVERLVRRALVGQLDGEPPESDYALAYPIFIALYAEHHSGRSRLYPGVREGLDYLLAAGYPLGCVTNKAEQFTLPLLDALGVRDAFGIVVSGDTLPEKKPHPMPLLHAAAHFRVAPADSLMIGDSVSDVSAARAAGFMGIVCTSYGYNHGRDIREAGPDAVIDSFVELAGLLSPKADSPESGS
jgi:phosphoglycolate phosphatase